MCASISVEDLGELVDGILGAERVLLDEEVDCGLCLCVLSGVFLHGERPPQTFGCRIAHNKRGEHVTGGDHEEAPWFHLHHEAVLRHQLEIILQPHLG